MTAINLGFHYVIAEGTTWKSEVIMQAVITWQDTSRPIHTREPHLT